MYQIDVASAATALPAPAAAGNPGYFTEGNPVSGAAATVVPADFLNTLMLELLGVVIAGGQAPSKTDNGQLLKGIKGLISGNLAQTGHLSIPVGPLTLIVNWGTGSAADGSGAQPVVFDQPFPNAGLWAIASNRAGAAPTAFHGTPVPGKTGMTVYSSNSSGAASPAGTAFFYLALGI